MNKSPRKKAAREAHPDEDGLKACEKIAQPFTAVDVATAVGCNKKKGANLIFKWKKKGWIKKTGWGQFERTKSFPGNRPGEAMLADIHREIESAKPKED